MAAKSRTLLIVVVVIVIIVIVCAAAYVLLKNNNNDNNNSSETEYWYYIYYGSNDPDNGWISAAESSGTPADGLTAAAGDVTFLSWGGIESINNVEPDYIADNESWYTWNWSVDSGSWVISADVMGNLTETTYFLGITDFSVDADGYLSVANLDPNAVSGWENGGPFAES